MLRDSILSVVKYENAFSFTENYALLSNFRVCIHALRFRSDTAMVM